MIRKLICFILLVMISHQQLSSLPISSELVLKLTLSMSKLQNTLQYFGTWSENKFDIYRRVKLTKGYLGQLNFALSQYNNVILGSNTAVAGNKNIVIGNYNNITGSNNWVFISNYTGKINGDLLLGKWRIEIDKDSLILVNPRFAISYIYEFKNQNFWGKYGKEKKFCSWKKKSSTITNTVQTTYPYGGNYPIYQNWFYGNLNKNNEYFGTHTWNWGW